MPQEKVVDTAFYAKSMVRAEVNANVRRLKELVRQLTCDAPKTVEDAARLANGNELARVTLLELMQIREQVSAFETKFYVITEE